MVNQLNLFGIDENAPTAIDLFSGPGGLGLGLETAGFNVLVAVDKVASCVETYRTNHPHTNAVEYNLHEIPTEDIVDLVKSAGHDSVDLVAGGPPCETFSTAGPGVRNTRDHRDHLFVDLIRIASALKSKYILIENVPGFMTKKNRGDEERGIFKDVLRTLIDFGYLRYDFRVLNAMNYGVPQSRNRVFLIATSSDTLPITFPHPTHGPDGRYPYVTVDGALSDLPLLEVAEEKNDYLSVPNNAYQRMMRSSSDNFGDFDSKQRDFKQLQLTLHIAPNHRARTVKRYEMISQGEGLKDLMTSLEPERLAELQAERILPQKWYSQRDRRLISDDVSPTVTSHVLDELLHPYDHRHVSPREAARLQSFPDWYYFEGPLVVPHNSHMQDKYEQIGDAIPPLLARALACEIAKNLNLV